MRVQSAPIAALSRAESGVPIEQSITSDLDEISAMIAVVVGHRARISRVVTRSSSNSREPESW